MISKEQVEDLKQRLICQRMVDVNGVKRRCHSKDPSYCAGCAKIHTRHTKFIIWSGITEKWEPSAQEIEIDGNHNLYFVTLTAPTFGKVHRVDSSSNNPTPCTCDKRQHVSTDTCASTPIDSSRYRYREQVLWNVWSNDLYRRTQEKLTRRLPGAEMCSVREPQKRCVVHYHILVRVPANISRKKAMKELRRMRMHTVEHDGETYGWGRQMDVQRVETDSENVAKAIWYISKLVGYTTKTIGVTVSGRSEEMDEFTKKLREVGATVKCHKSNCKGSECTEKAHEDFGFHGHQFTQTDGWSFSGLTYKSLQEEMQAYAEAKAAESDDPDAYQKAMIIDFNRYGIIAEFEMANIIGEEQLHQVSKERKASAKRWAKAWLSPK